MGKDSKLELSGKSLDYSAMALGELARKRFNQFNEETEFGFRVRLDKLLAEKLSNVRIKRVSDDLEVVEIVD